MASSREAYVKQQSYDISALNILVLEKHVLLRKLLTDVFREFGVPTVQSTPEPEKAWMFFQAEGQRRLSSFAGIE